MPRTKASGRGVRLLAPSLAATSQALGLLQLVLLFHRLPAGPASDAYFYLCSWSLLPTQIVLLGVVYPLWLRSARLSRARLGYVVLGVAIASAGASIGAASILVGLGKSYSGIWLHCTLLAGVGALSAVGWAGALRSAAIGRPGWLSSVTLLSSLFACCALAVPAHQLASRVTAMCIGLLAGAALFALLVLIYGARESGTATLAETPLRSSGWYLTKSVTGYGAGISLQSMAASMATSSLSSLNVVIKVVSGFSTVVTNTVMPRLVHSRVESPRAAFRYAWRVLLLSIGLGAAAGLAELGIGGRYPALALVVAAWILASSLSSAMQRVALRFFSPRYSALSIAVSVAVPAITVALRIIGDLHLSAVFAAYVFLDLVTGTGLAYVMGARRLAAASGVVAVGMLAVGVLLLQSYSL